MIPKVRKSVQKQSNPSIRMRVLVVSEYPIQENVLMSKKQKQNKKAMHCYVEKAGKKFLLTQPWCQGPGGSSLCEGLFVCHQTNQY